MQQGNTAVRLKLNICLRTGMKMAEQPFMMKPGISSSLTDFEGFYSLDGFGDIRIRNRSKG
jgi:hypothetical protein